MIALSMSCHKQPDTRLTITVMDDAGALLSSFSSDNSNKDQNASPESFAFVVHSQDTVNQNLPPEVDNPPLARQKRRRTR